MLVSATLHAKLGALASRILRDPVQVGLTAPVAPDGTLALEQAVLAGEEASYELPKGLQQLYMDVPLKLRLPTLLGAPLPCRRTDSAADVRQRCRCAHTAAPRVSRHHTAAPERCACAGTVKLCFSRTPKCKLVLFLTTCDSVELHHALLTHAYRAALGQDLVACPVLKLHGDMPPLDRTGEGWVQGLA